MDVVASNFEEALAKLRSAVSDCDFISLDTEFTGLDLHKHQRVSSADSLEVRYQKIKGSGSQFLLLQIGVCVFTAVEVKEQHGPTKISYRAAPFNFYIFPDGSVEAQATTVCQISSLQFLASHGFDFNRCIRHGIPYLSHSEYRSELQKLERRREKRQQQEPSKSNKIDISSVRQRDKDFLEESISRVNHAFGHALSQGADDPLSTADQLEKNETNGVAAAKSGEESEQTLQDEQGRHYILLPPCNAYLRRLLYQEIAEKCSELLIVTKEIVPGSNGRGNASLRITAFDSLDSKEAAAADELNAIHEKAMRQLQSRIGARGIFDVVCDAKVPVIGHNCLLDIAHLFSKFVGPLGDTLAGFAGNVNSYLPCIFDTKTLLTANSILYQEVSGATNLGDAYDAIVKSKFGGPGTITPVFSMADGFPAYDSSRHHEAGYDAYMTGCIFASCMFVHGAGMADLSEWNKRVRESGKCDEISHPLGSLVNQLYLMRLGGKLLRLPGPNEEFDRSKFVHATGFPLAAKTGDFYRAFHACNIERVHWLDDHNVFMEFKDDISLKTALDLSSRGAKGHAKGETVQNNDNKDGPPSHCLDFDMLELQPFSEYERRQADFSRVSSSSTLSRKRPVPASSDPARNLKRQRTAEEMPAGEADKQSVTADSVSGFASSKQAKTSHGANMWCAIC